MGRNSCFTKIPGHKAILLYITVKFSSILYCSISLQLYQSVRHLYVPAYPLYERKVSAIDVLKFNATFYTLVPRMKLRCQDQAGRLGQDRHIH